MKIEEREVVQEQTLEGFHEKLVKNNRQIE